MPTGVDPAETGEAFEDNAMPWDSINAATYSKTGDMVPFEPELLKDHQQRIAQNPEFQYIAQDIAHYKALKDKRNIVSLNLAVREENHDDDATRLKRINERLERAGKKPLKSLDDLPKDYQEPDPYLDETVHIALDLAHLEKNSPLSSQRRPNKAASGRMKTHPRVRFYNRVTCCSDGFLAVAQPEPDAGNHHQQAADQRQQQRDFVPEQPAPGNIENDADIAHHRDHDQVIGGKGLG